MAYNILLVDDDKEFRQELAESLDEFSVIEASSGSEALEILSRPNEIDVVILDVVMPGPSGTEILKRIKAKSPDLGVVILTGHGTKSTVIEALKGRADDYLEKPVDPPKAITIIRRLIGQQALPQGVAPGGLDAKINRVIRFLERNFDKRVSLSDAAELVALSPKYLSRVFKEKTGKGFDEFRLDIRMDKAGDLLRTTDYSVEEISYRMGYENAESFGRLFKRIKGSTPSAYRQESRSADDP